VPAPSKTITTDAAAKLETLLGELIEAHKGMLELTTEHRRAISRADGAGVQMCVEHQGVLAARIAAMDVERKKLVLALTGGAASAPPTITILAERLPEPMRGRIVGLAAALRELLVRLQRETAVVRAATQSLVAHMDGLMQQVARSLSQARLYGPRGRIDPGGPVACGLDLTH
jgi:flagellar FlgN protein